MRIFQSFLLLLLPVLAIVAGDAGLRPLRVTLVPVSDTEATLVVELRTPASLYLHYDSQVPADPANLERYWFQATSDKVTNRHEFRLEELETRGAYTCRLSSRSPEARVSAVFTWHWKRGMKETQVVSVPSE